MKNNATWSFGNGSFQSVASKSGSFRSIFIARALLVFVFFSTLLPTPDSIVPNRVLAAPGDLVPGFGTAGVVMTDFAGGNDSAQAITTNRFGKIIAAGSATIPGKGTDFALACYDGDGVLDSTFGTSGKVTTDFFGANDGARGVVVQPDQKIVLSGFATNGSERQWALARFNVDGQLDPTFDQDGKVVLDLGSTSEAFKVALQGDGKIVAVGDSRPQTSLDFTAVRLNPDGSLDSSFGNNGVVRVDFGFTDRAIDLAIGGDNIRVCGIVVKTATDSDFGIASLNSNGSLDNTFGGDGTVRTDFFGGRDGAQAIIRSNIGNVEYWLLAGFATGATPGQPEDLALARYNSDGSLDLSFDGDGKKTVDFSGGRDLAFGLLEQPDGDYLATGWAGIGTSFDLGITKVDGSGNLDSGWGLQGEYTLDAVSGGNNVAFDGMIYGTNLVTAGVGLNPVFGNDDWIITQHENERFVDFTKEVSPNPAVIGDIVTYTFTIKNRTDKRLSVRVWDFLPEGGSFSPQNGWISQISYLRFTTLVSALIDIPAGETRKRFLRVSANQNGALKNKAKLYSFRPISFFEVIDEDILGEATVESEVKRPEITDATRDGKNLRITGLFGDSTGASQSVAMLENAIGPQASCPVVLYDGVEQKTNLDPDNPSTVLIVKKGYKKLAPGQTVRIRVRLCSGIETDDFIYTRPQ